jgi:hypothetical protein
MEMNKPVPIVEVERRIDRLLGVVLIALGFLGLLAVAYRLVVVRAVGSTLLIALWSLVVLLMGVLSWRNK